MVRETSLEARDLIYPLFVEPGSGVRRPVPSMPGISRFSVDTLVDEARSAQRLGVGAVLLFGIPPDKDAIGSSGFATDGIVPTAIRALKDALPDLVVIADVCLCEYTDHGHCGVLRDGEVQNDETLPYLARAALAYAEAGADVVAPSDMMDGRVGAIRQTLDESGFSHTPILSYAVKYASAFYGPFRDVAESRPAEGDRRGYQMDPGNAREALRMAARDLEEGADWLIVKPGLAYLDIVRTLRDTVDVPIAAYNVSGEYAMLHAAAEKGWIDGPQAMMEMLLSMKRAGADQIITYHALDAARRIAEEQG